MFVNQIIYWLHHQIACCWMIICNYANMTCCINVSSKIDRIHNCECSHNCDMWCSKIVIASKYHNCSPLVIVILEYVDLLSLTGSCAQKCLWSQVFSTFVILVPAWPSAQASCIILTRAQQWLQMPTSDQYSSLINPWLSAALIGLHYALKYGYARYIQLKI